GPTKQAPFLTGGNRPRVRSRLCEGRGGIVAAAARRRRGTLLASTHLQPRPVPAPRPHRLDAVGATSTTRLFFVRPAGGRASGRRTVGMRREALHRDSWHSSKDGDVAPPAGPRRPARRL